jgi:hypothetical protein
MVYMLRLKFYSRNAVKTINFLFTKIIIYCLHNFCIRDKMTVLPIKFGVHFKIEL